MGLEDSAAVIPARVGRLVDDVSGRGWAAHPTGDGAVAQESVQEGMRLLFKERCQQLVRVVRPSHLVGDSVLRHGAAPRTGGKCVKLPPLVQRVSWFARNPATALLYTLVRRS